MPRRYYTPPEELAGTVFDPHDETFGPIMAALQAGDFEAAAELVATLTGLRRGNEYREVKCWIEEGERVPRYEVKCWIEVEAKDERDALQKAVDIADAATVNGRVVVNIDDGVYLIEET